MHGARVLGDYPESLLETSSVNIGRNHRIMPTTPWESVWTGVSEWFGVPSERMAGVLPNAANFAPATLLSAQQLFGSS